MIFQKFGLTLIGTICANFDILHQRTSAQLIKNTSPWVLRDLFIVTADSLKFKLNLDYRFHIPLSALQSCNQRQTKSSICSTAHQHSTGIFLFKINTFMCCVISSLEETVSYPPLVLFKGLEDKKLLKFYLLILTTFPSHMESWLFLPCQDSAQPSFHAGQGNILIFHCGTIISSFCFKNSNVDKVLQINLKLVHTCRTCC